MSTRSEVTLRRLSLPIAVMFVALTGNVGVSSRTSLRAVRIMSEGGVTVIVLDADGALPTPNVGVVDNPPRIYLDFNDVGTVTHGSGASGNILVRAVRVAVNQSQPLVTRVVIDLVAPAPHRIDTAMRERGHISIVVGSPVGPSTGGTPQMTPPKPADIARPAVATAPPQPPTPPPAAQPPLPTPAPPAAAVPRPPSPTAAASPLSLAASPNHPAPPAPAPAVTLPDTAATRARTFAEFASKARATSVRAPERDIERYLRSASAPLDRLQALRPVLASLDALAPLPEERLTSAAQEFDAIQRVLSAIQPPRTLDVTHEELRRMCGLGATAARARLDRSVGDDATRGWNAASAAAGAIMLLERARAKLGMAGSTADAPR